MMKKTIKKSFAVLLTLLTVVFIMPISSRAVTTDIPSDAVEFNGHYYYAFDEDLTWSEAKTKCEAMGGYLATIHSDAEHNVVRSVLKETSDRFFWIGGYRTDSVSNWQWVTGETFSYDRQKTTSVSGNSSCNYLAMYAGEGAFPAGLMQYWLQLTNNGTFYLIEISCKYHTGYICEWGEPNGSDRWCPDWYDFYKDSYSFRNFSVSIDNEFFQKLYGDGVGFDLWRERRNQGGVCFGMTYTTASLLNGYPDCDEIRKKFLLNDDLLSVSSTVKIGRHTYSIKDYITYAQIYQLSSEFQQNSTWTDINTIYDCVKAYLQENKIGVTVGMSRKDGKGGHRVLAVGIEGSDILIDDPNNTKDLERITVGDNGEWSFSGLSGWNDKTCWIRYSTDYNMPYQVLLSETQLGVSGNSNEQTTPFSLETKNDNRKQNLLTVSNDINISLPENSIEIIVDDYNSTTQSGNKQFWINEDSVFASTGVAQKGEVRCAGNDVVLSATITEESNVILTLDDEQANIKIDSIESNDYTVSVVYFPDERTAVEVQVSGVADGDSVTAEKTADGIVVKGLNNITVKYLKDDIEVGNTIAEVKDGREVNITVDESKDTVKTDFVGEQTEDICGYCGKVHGTSFKEVLIKFFHRIFYFFVKLFGLKK